MKIIIFPIKRRLNKDIIIMISGQTKIVIYKKSKVSKDGIIIATVKQFFFFLVTLKQTVIKTETKNVI